MRHWWSKTYNRPLKDPLLASYTLEELLYEFYEREERAAFDAELVEQETDRIEEEKESAAHAWADEEEAKEEEEYQRYLAEKAAKEKAKEEPVDPREDPENIEWMNKVIEEEKKKRGEDFGEDVELEF